jgi:hypothetical protein
MAEPSSQIKSQLIQNCSRVLLWEGPAVFLIGKKFLHEIKHVEFMTAEAAGIVGGYRNPPF